MPRRNSNSGPRYLGGGRGAAVGVHEWLSKQPPIEHTYWKLSPTGRLVSAPTPTTRKAA